MERSKRRSYVSYGEMVVIPVSVRVAGTVAADEADADSFVDEYGHARYGSLGSTVGRASCAYNQRIGQCMALKARLYPGGVSHWYSGPSQTVGKAARPTSVASVLVVPVGWHCLGQSPVEGHEAFQNLCLEQSVLEHC